MVRIPPPTFILPRSDVGLRRHEVVRLVVAVLAFAAIYSLVGILRHRDFNSSVDLAIFNQGVWLLSRLEAPFSSIKGYNIFGDHFHPVIALFVPFYRLAPGPETLIAVQGLFFSASIVPVYLFLRRRFSATPSFATSSRNESNLVTGTRTFQWPVNSSPCVRSTEASAT